MHQLLIDILVEAKSNETREVAFYLYSVLADTTFEKSKKIVSDALKELDNDKRKRNSKHSAKSNQ